MRCRWVSLGEPGKQVWYVDLPLHLACTLNDDVDDLARGSLDRSRPLFTRRPSFHTIQGVSDKSFACFEGTGAFVRRQRRVTLRVVGGMGRNRVVDDMKDLAWLACRKSVLKCQILCRILSDDGTSITGT